MSAQQILIGFGCLLVLIGILGGGFELKELKIPAVSGMARTIAGAVGIALIILSSYMSMQSASQQAPSQTAVPSEARKPYTKNDLNSNILVISASYGNNCGAPRGNVTRNLAIACDGTTSCTYIIDFEVIGDPALGCAKNYLAEWRCGVGQAIHQSSAGAEAGYKTPIHLSCP